jgi:hypothetical protein
MQLFCIARSIVAAHLHRAQCFADKRKAFDHPWVPNKNVYAPQIKGRSRVEGTVDIEYHRPKASTLLHEKCIQELKHPCPSVFCEIEPILQEQGSSS